MTPANGGAGSPGHELEPSPRWVRVRFGGQTVADSKRVMLLREPGRLPVYYFPRADVRADLRVPVEHGAHCLDRGGAVCWTVRVGDRTAEHAAWGAADTHPALRDHVAFEWAKMDAWFEEDDEVYVHARDPYKRVDVLHGSRHVRVVVGGELVAESRRPALLFETGLPTRYYLPKADVRMDLLVPTDTETRCPYKGVATYYAVRVGSTLVPDLAWCYRHPIPECSKIENLVCFFNERVDALYVDGELQPKPRTRWSVAEADPPAPGAAPTTATR
ncbi:MAG: DUF427 domain-containing protein [Candidatus Rokuibacteriota bacterium]